LALMDKAGKSGKKGDFADKALENDKVREMKHHIISIEELEDNFQTSAIEVSLTSNSKETRTQRGPCLREASQVGQERAHREGRYALVLHVHPRNDWLLQSLAVVRSLPLFCWLCH
jgi:hypothetical protein